MGIRRPILREFCLVLSSKDGRSSDTSAFITPAMTEKYKFRIAARPVMGTRPRIGPPSPYGVGPSSHLGNASFGWSDGGPETYPPPAGRDSGRGLLETARLARLSLGSQHPLKEIKSPRALGNVGVKETKGKDFETSNPAALAALLLGGSRDSGLEGDQGRRRSPLYRSRQLCHPDTLGAEPIWPVVLRHGSRKGRNPRTQNW